MHDVSGFIVANAPTELRQKAKIPQR